MSRFFKKTWDSNWGSLFRARVYTKKVFSFLAGTNVTFIIPERRHSKQMKKLLEGTKSRFGMYIMKNKPFDIPLEIAIVVKYLKDKGSKKGSKNLWYVYHSLSTGIQFYDIYLQSSRSCWKISGWFYFELVFLQWDRVRKLLIGAYFDLISIPYVWETIKQEFKCLGSVLS